MRYTLLLSIFLIACSPVPVKQSWPSIPEQLKYTCPDLKEIEKEKPQLTDILNNVVENYATYYECQAKSDAWIEWYDEQKKIHDEVNKK
jgi:hypothetical protein